MQYVITSARLETDKQVESNLNLQACFRHGAHSARNLWFHQNCLGHLLEHSLGSLHAGCMSKHLTGCQDKERALAAQVAAGTAAECNFLFLLKSSIIRRCWLSTEKISGVITKPSCGSGLLK